MGLARLRKSLQIVNHPPTQPETAAPIRQTPPAALKDCRKCVNCFTYKQ